MPEPNDSTLRCPHCAKAYRWKAELGGKKVQCKCGQKFQIPEDPAGRAEPIGPPPGEAATDDAIYEVAEPDNAGAPGAKDTTGARSGGGSPSGGTSGGGGGRCPSCGSKIKPEAVICLNCGFNLAEGRKVKTQVTANTAGGPAAAGTTGGALVASDPVATAMAGNLSARDQRDAEMAEEAARRHRFEAYTLPPILIAVGLLVVTLSNLAYGLLPEDQSLFETSSLFNGVEMLLKAAVEIVITIPLLFVGLFVVAKLFGTGFGGIGTGLLKLAAVAACTIAANDLMLIAIYFITGGTSVMTVETWMALGASFIVFIGLCVKLLDMDPLEAFILFLILIFGPWIALLIIAVTVGSLFA